MTNNNWSGFGGLDLSGVEAEKGRQTLAPGTYNCKITEVEIRDNKARNGKLLFVRLTDEKSGSHVDDVINVANPTAKAVEIGLQRLKALLIAANHPNPDKPGDVKTMLNLHVGVHVEQGEDWTDNSGNTRPGGGKPRRSGAYFPVGTIEEDKLGPMPAAVAAQAALYSKPRTANKQSGSDFDDDIPF